MMEKLMKVAGPIALVIALVALVIVVIPEAEEPIARTYGCSVYTEQGCGKFVVESGGEIEMQSGSTLDIQSGTTSTYGGDLTVTGQLNVSDDVKVGDGTPTTTLNGEDMYVEGTFEVDGALNLDGAVDMDSTLDVAGNVSDGAGTFTIADDVMIDGAADAIQLKVQGYTTQTTSLLVLEQSDGTDKLTVSNAGNTDIAGTLQYGANDLYALGHASSGQQAIYGTASITGTLAAPHGLTTVTFCLAVMGEDPTSGGGDAAHVTVAVSGNVCTLKAWQDDFVTAATEADVAVHWLVIGAP
jgi:hypothetical protein